MVRKHVQEILEETDPERRLALSRKLREEIWDKLSEEELRKLADSGVKIPAKKRPFRDDN